MLGDNKVVSRTGPQLLTISAFTENNPGVLHRLTAVFTRRKVNVESLCVSETETKGISRFTISISIDEAQAQKIIAQIAKIIEVVYVSYNTEDDLIFKEIAFFKVVAKDSSSRSLIQQNASVYGASIAYAHSDFLIIEKTGSENEVNSLYLLLEPLGILEFSRSGRIAMLKDRSINIEKIRKNITTSHV
jgi:acetolactate synthase-1/3 small subunit